MVVLLLLLTLVFALGSCVTGALVYALRDYSRSQLEAVLEKMGRAHRFAPITEHVRDFQLCIASLRVVAILLLLGSLLQLADRIQVPDYLRYVTAIVVAALVSVFFSVGLASSIAAYFGETLIARLDGFLHAMRSVFWPILVVLHATDRFVFKVSPHSRADAAEQAEQQVEDEVLAAVDEGVKEGVVDEADREMIESVIEFRDTTAGQIMTARPDIVALPVTATLDEITDLIETSGHSRLPIYEGGLDHILGILYARDLLNILAEASRRRVFDLRKVLRTPVMIPETKPLKDLLREFRLRKVHLAIVLDEYGGTAGLITIEDVLEELVGEISDEHEPTAPPALLKVNDITWDVDARTYIDEVNAVIGLSIPEDQGFDTLGGYVSSLLGRIPEVGEEFTTPSVAWRVTDAEPTRINRLRLTLVPPESESSERPEPEAERA